MKITMYELLGLIKDGKAPKKIKYCGCIYEWEEDWYLTKEKFYRVCLGGRSEDINQLYNAFNENVEVLEEVAEDEFEDIEKTKSYEDFEGIDDYIEHLKNKINSLIQNQKKIIEQLKNKD